MKILVLGELNVDLVLRGLPSLPVLGRELLASDFRLTLGSSSAITAVRLAALGTKLDFAGIGGNDDFGRFMLHELKNAGIGTKHVETVDISTGVTVALSYEKDRALLTYPGTIAAYTGHNISVQILSEYQHIHVGGFYLQHNLQPELPRIFQMAHEAGLSTSLDVGWDSLEQWGANPYLEASLAQTDYFFPNEFEAEALSAGDLENLARKTAKLLLVKRGSEGAAAYNHQGKIAEVPALAVQVIDTTGAGDAFNAGFIYAHRVEEKSLKESLLFAAACGSQAVTQLGGATGAPTAEEIWRLIEQVQR
jgi:sugar/nucleoside kinase (ribokinase family)